MPSGIIQPRLPAFLDLLQLKNQGRQPPLLADDIQLQMEVTQWYALDRMQDVVSSPYALLRNQFDTLRIVQHQVPDGTYWMLRAIAVQMNYTLATCTAVKFAKLVPTATLDGNSSLPIELCAPMAFDSAGFTWPGTQPVIVGPSVMFNTPVLLPPRTYLGFNWIGEITDAVNNVNMFTTISYAALQL